MGCLNKYLIKSYEVKQQLSDEVQQIMAALFIALPPEFTVYFALASQTNVTAEANA